MHCKSCESVTKCLRCSLVTTRVGASHLSKGARVEVDAVVGVVPPEPTLTAPEVLAPALLDYTTDFVSVPDGSRGESFGGRHDIVPGRRPVMLKMALSLLFLVGMIGAGFVVGGGFGGAGSADSAVSAPAPVALQQTGDVPSLDVWEPPTLPVDNTVTAESSTQRSAFSAAASELAADLAVEPAPASTVLAPTPTVPLTVARAAAAPTTVKPVPTTVKAVPTTVKPAPTTAKPAPAPTAPPATSAPASGGQAATLACIRKRESGGNYSIVSPGGTYMGAYQFAQSTWNATANHAGRPDLVGVKPNLASPADQDALALHLLNWQGLAPWGGYCG